MSEWRKNIWAVINKGTKKIKEDAERKKQINKQTYKQADKISM